MRYTAIYPQNSLSQKPKRAAVFTTPEWNKMQWKLVEHQVEAEAINAMREKELLKKEKSREMTKNWSNTVEQIQIQREQKLRDAARKEEEEKVRVYEEIIERKKKEREEAFERAKKIIYESKDTSRAILSGVTLSAVLEERVRQIELKKQLRQKKIEAEAIESDLIRKEVEAYKEELKKNELHEIDKKRRNGEMLKEQCAEMRKIRQQLNEELLREREDNIYNCKEINEIEEQDRIDAIKRKNKLKAEEQKQRSLLRERQEQQKQEEINQDKLNAIYRDVKEKLEKQRKEVEKMIRKEEAEKRAAIAEKVRAEHFERDDEESRLKAIEEKELKYQKEQKEREERKKKLREELLTLEKEAAAGVKAQRERDFEMRRWALLQRLALDEADRKLKECEELEKACKQKKLRQILIEQWKERHERDIKEKMDDIANFLKARADERDALLKYCAEAEKFTREMKWPIYPVTAVIKSTLKSAGIPEDKREVPFLQSRVPIASVKAYEKKE